MCFLIRNFVNNENITISSIIVIEGIGAAVSMIEKYKTKEIVNDQNVMNICKIVAVA